MYDIYSIYIHVSESTPTYIVFTVYIAYMPFKNLCIMICAYIYRYSNMRTYIALAVYLAFRPFKDLCIMRPMRFYV